jgi:hypothetical protein
MMQQAMVNDVMKEKKALKRIMKTEKEKNDEKKVVTIKILKTKH